MQYSHLHSVCMHVEKSTEKSRRLHTYDAEYYTSLPTADLRHATRCALIKHAEIVAIAKELQKTHSH